MPNAGMRNVLKKIGGCCWWCQASLELQAGPDVLILQSTPTVVLVPTCRHISCTLPTHNHTQHRKSRKGSTGQSEAMTEITIKLRGGRKLTAVMFYQERKRAEEHRPPLSNPKHRTWYPTFISIWNMVSDIYLNIEHGIRHLSA